MGFPIPVRQDLYTEAGSSCQEKIDFEMWYFPESISRILWKKWFDRTDPRMIDGNGGISFRKICCDKWIWMMDWVIIIPDDGRKPSMAAIFWPPEAPNLASMAKKNKKSYFFPQGKCLYKFYELWVKILGDIAPKSVRDMQMNKQKWNVYRVIWCSWK